MAVHGLLDHDHEHDHDGDDSITDGRKAKRELSQSKRAAQNRAAQVSAVRMSARYFWEVGQC